MENTNTDRKSLSDLVKEADESKMTIVIIGAGEVGSKVAEVIANKNFMAIRVENLNEKDVEMFDRANKKNPAFERPPIPFINTSMDMPEIFISYEKKSFGGFRRKKLKGYQK